MDMGTVVKQNLTVLSQMKVILALVSVICIKQFSIMAFLCVNHVHYHSASLINPKLHLINYQHAITQPSHIIHSWSKFWNCWIKDFTFCTVGSLEGSKWCFKKDPKKLHRPWVRECNWLSVKTHDNQNVFKDLVSYNGTKLPIWSLHKSIKYGTLKGGRTLYSLMRKKWTLSRSNNAKCHPCTSRDCYHSNELCVHDVFHQSCCLM